MREAPVWEIKCEDWTRLTEHTETFNKILRSGDATSTSYLFSSLFGLRLSIFCMAASISLMQNRTKALNTKDSTGREIFVHIISLNALRNSLFCSNATYLTSFVKIIITIVSICRKQLNQNKVLFQVSMPCLFWICWFTWKWEYSCSCCACKHLIGNIVIIRIRTLFGVCCACKQGKWHFIFSL